VQGWPAADLTIRALATNSPQQPGRALDVRLLGRDEPLRFTQDTTGLHITLPTTKPPTADIGIALRINFA
jgi:alpha-L-fucosidase